MNLFDLIQSPLVLVLYAFLILAVLKIIAPDGIDFDDLLPFPKDREWPRGPQEEEPIRWRVELLHPRIETTGSGAVEPAVQPNAPART